jgi:hypothetical protein
MKHTYDGARSSPRFGCPRFIGIGIMEAIRLDIIAESDI